MKSVCVYCGSNRGTRPGYLTAAHDLGRELCRRNLQLVYGGGNVGLMGAIADAVMEGGGRVVGVIPEALQARELAHDGLTELHVVRTMHERKAMMADLADAFIALPGGLGTFEELFEALTWAQLGIHGKPCGVLNVAGYYDPLLAMVGHACAEGFVREAHAAALMASDNPSRLLDAMAAYTPPNDQKWGVADEE